MACLQSFDPVLGGPAASKNSSGSLKEDLKDDRIRRQHEVASSQNEDHGKIVDQPLYPASQPWWVEQQGNASHRTFIALGERYEMVRFDSVPYNNLATVTTVCLLSQVGVLQSLLFLFNLSTCRDPTNCSVPSPDSNRQHISSTSTDCFRYHFHQKRNRFLFTTNSDT